MSAKNGSGLGMTLLGMGLTNLFLHIECDNIELLEDEADSLRTVAYITVSNKGNHKNLTVVTHRQKVANDFYYWQRPICVFL